MTTGQGEAGTGLPSRLVALRSLLWGGAPTTAAHKPGWLWGDTVRSDAFWLGSEEGTVPSPAVLSSSRASPGREQGCAERHRGFDCQVDGHRLWLSPWAH